MLPNDKHPHFVSMFQAANDENAVASDENRVYRTGTKQRAGREAQKKGCENSWGYLLQTGIIKVIFYECFRQGRWAEMGPGSASPQRGKMTLGALEGNEGTEDHKAAPLTLEFCWERKAFLELPCLTQILQPGLLPAQGARSPSLSFLTDFLLPARIFSNLQLRNSRRKKSRACS